MNEEYDPYFRDGELKHREIKWRKITQRVCKQGSGGTEVRSPESQSSALIARPFSLPYYVCIISETVMSQQFSFIYLALVFPSYYSICSLACSFM